MAATVFLLSDTQEAIDALWPKRVFNPRTKRLAANPERRRADRLLELHAQHAILRALAAGAE